MAQANDFYCLTPEHVLTAVEHVGQKTTGLCQPLNSLENRVYEVQLADESRVIAKFYRPGRWSHDTINDEHRLLLALAEDEVPVCPPLVLADGLTLHTTEHGIFFALFARCHGRAADEFHLNDLEQLGRLVARIHNVAATMTLAARPALSPQTYGKNSMALLDAHAVVPLGLTSRLRVAAEELITRAAELFRGVKPVLTHADFHRGNLLRHPDRGWYVLDFDDSAWAPAVQDLWLILSGRPSACPTEVAALLQGYEQLRHFDRSQLRLIEALRGLRYLRYAAWISSRWQDPAFPRTFAHFATDNFWQSLLADIEEQNRLLAA